MRGNHVKLVYHYIKNKPAGHGQGTIIPHLSNQMALELVAFHPLLLHIAAKEKQLNSSVSMTASALAKVFA
ncbi:hypothetical protein H671_8g19472 [Cricetulus griseus]|uniref:Uncharacterized protein n=1 Tax=Cricetulus griseus TaxID=10029 RepID=A0A061HZX4_CRIGR|nr:hypothetical protein H671_8g19472 [Cricetulus griseus]